MTARGQAPVDTVPRGAYVNLILAALGFLLTAWAWGLISPLSAVYKQQLGLTSLQQSILVAVPVLVGSLGRIPVGGLTDVLGARKVLPAIALLTILPVLALSVAGDSYPAMLAVGFFLGLGGTPFAAAIPHGNGWFPPAKRGFALGVIGMGMGGTAIAALLTKPMRRSGRTRSSTCARSCWRSTAWWPGWCCATRPAGPCRASRSATGSPRRHGCR
ncbi:MFS transporter [Catellatospora bangladeshensis]|uniref:MFS transporter n=1 Tax=Catellatospora bangladeshensis TaxID=310355 RepID=UPI00361A5A76